MLQSMGLQSQTRLSSWKQQWHYYFQFLNWNLQWVLGWHHMCFQSNMSTKKTRPFVTYAVGGDHCMPSRSSCSSVCSEEFPLVVQPGAPFTIPAGEVTLAPMPEVFVTFREVWLRNNFAFFTPYFQSFFFHLEVKDTKTSWMATSKMVKAWFLSHPMVEQKHNHGMAM